jgi:D-tagatose-1,6-bisphosphate aldolase subunit GatZ/KbaZ
MYLDEIVGFQKRGQARGITSICSAHPWVLKVAMQKKTGMLLIESTCNQVNQFGGYTGMTPADFVSYVRRIAEENQCPFDNMTLGGDHLGPSPWKNEPAESAMQKAEALIHEYVQAGFVKIHLDCSMRLADDPAGVLDVGVSARRAARLANIAEKCGNKDVRYVIGTEVPVPGGATEREETVSVTKVEDARQTIEVTREAFEAAGLGSAWERVSALVVQPGVEFGDNFVFPYQPELAQELSHFVESQSMIYEAHSTDYQTREALKELVRDHFAILKVGPGLTFAFREAVFALAMMEDELVAKSERSNLKTVLDDLMLKHPEHWHRYYHGDEREQAFKRRYSLSDRVRYYWVYAEVQSALETLLRNLADRTLPFSLLSQFAGTKNMSAAQVIEWKIGQVLDDYLAACDPREQISTN